MYFFRVNFLLEQRLKIVVNYIWGDEDEFFVHTSQTSRKCRIPHLRQVKKTPLVGVFFAEEGERLEAVLAIRSFLLSFREKLGVCDLGEAVLCHIFAVIELFKSNMSVQVIVIVTVDILGSQSEHALLL